MLKKFVSGAIFGLFVASGPGTIATAVVATGLMVGASTAEAQARTGKTILRPPYGPPFNQPGAELDFFGEVNLTDGGCNVTGLANNIACGGSLSFTSATLKFGLRPPNINDTPVALQTINFTSDQFGTVLAIDRQNLTNWSGIYSTAFRAVQGTVESPPITKYDPDGPGAAPPAQAWFSLIFLGEYAQLIWFRDDPGVPLFSPSDAPLNSRSFEYAGCLLLGAGDNYLSPSPLWGGSNRCGTSSWDKNQGAPLLDVNGNRGITVVPEPATYGLALMGLGVIGFMSLISRRRSAKR